MGKTTDQELSFLTSCLLGLSKRPVRHAFDVAEVSDECESLPAASRPFALKTAGDDDKETETFGITVKAVKGGFAPVAVGGVSPFDSIDVLKLKAARALVAAGIAVDQHALRLVYKGKSIAGQGKTVADFAIASGAVVHYMIAANTEKQGDAKHKDAFDEHAAKIGANSLFWNNMDKSVLAQFGGNREHANKVMNSFIVGFAGLLTDKDAAAAVKAHARK
ncbi:hypothetical protein HDU98_007471 [Podochytrium sp. JEL0797]|nr:hypothetical protein HDU98_007471 [Podochytrium sp. JEL0797]